MSSRRQPIFRPKHGPAGLAILILTYLVAIAGFVIAAFARAKSSFLLGAAALGLIGGAPFLARWSRRLRTQIVLDLPRFLELLRGKKVPLVVYLREFNRDLDKDFWDVEHGVVASWEESLLGDLRAYGAVLAVGIPGEALPHGGAYRVYLGAEWRSTVDTLLDAAAVIVFRCGNTPGITWEFERLSGTGRLERTVFATCLNGDASRAVYAKLRSQGLQGTDAEAQAEASLARIREVAERRPDLITAEQLASLSQLPAVIAGASHLMFAPFWVVVHGSITGWNSIDEVMSALGNARRRSGVFDTEAWWRAENVVGALGVACLVLFIALVVLAFIPGMETAFAWVLGGAVLLFFLAFVLRP